MVQLHHVFRLFLSYEFLGTCQRQHKFVGWSYVPVVTYTIHPSTRINQLLFRQTKPCAYKGRDLQSVTAADTHLAVNSSRLRENPFVQQPSEEDRNSRINFHQLPPHRSPSPFSRACRR